jgi:outer membrane lipoprotein-sorting protein
MKILLFLLFSCNVWASETINVENIQNYLNSIRSFKANFLQEDSFGNNGKGVIYLQKPYNFRIETLQPFHNVIIGDESLIVFHDYELNETSHATSGNEAINLLVADRINFNDPKIEIISFTNNPNTTEIEFADKMSPDLGSMTMTFRNHPIELVQVKTKKENITVVMNFYNRETNTKIDKKHFTFDYLKVKNPYSYQQR